jgi:sigma-B regulation protein RsbU (phosphoserine phosphatase)
MPGLLDVSESEFARKPWACDRICDHYAQEAKLIQSSLVPVAPLRHEAVEIAFRFVPLNDVGGDFVDFFRLPDGVIGLYLGDVVGKGLPAAMYGALVTGTLRGIHKTGTDTARVLALLNERLLQRPIRGRFCSTLYALFNPATSELTFSNAGMPLPLLASTGTCRQLGDGGFPSGMFPGATYQQYVVQLHAEDCVLFASDGLYELQNREGVQYCATQMENIWAQCHRKSVDFALDRQMLFSSGFEPQDDITVVALKVLV